MLSMEVFFTLNRCFSSLVSLLRRLRRRCRSPACDADINYRPSPPLQHIHIQLCHSSWLNFFPTRSHRLIRVQVDAAWCCFVAAFLASRAISIQSRCGMGLLDCCLLSLKSSFKNHSKEPRVVSSMLTRSDGLARVQVNRMSRCIVMDFSV